MNEENLNEDLKNNNIIVTFGKLETDNKRNIKFPPENAGKKGVEICKETSDTITIKVKANTAEIIKKLGKNKEDIVH